MQGVGGRHEADSTSWRSVPQVSQDEACLPVRRGGMGTEEERRYAEHRATARVEPERTEARRRERREIGAGRRRMEPLHLWGGRPDDPPL